VERLRDKVAIVTGAGSGIGRAIAARLASEGARVVVADRDAEAGEDAAREIGSGAQSRPVDVTRAAEVEALVSGVRSEHGALHVLVNNAGVGVAGTAPETSEDDWRRIMDVGLTGTFYGLKYGIPAIRDSGGGSIVNVASVAGLVGIPDRAAYCASKGGIIALTRAAAIDHAREGVRINCIAPGTVDTPWVRRITADYPDPEAARAAMRDRQPHGRLVTPDEIAAMAAYLASDEAGSVVGAVMIVDGGLTAR
jgi:NAD(P)-dependent dehydrogenase (short-subunit alcohol dehydrogenase family)